MPGSESVVFTIFLALQNSILRSLSFYLALSSCLPAPKLSAFMSFSNLSSSFNFQTWASASSWAYVTSQTAYSRGQPLVATLCIPSLSQPAMCSVSNKHTRWAGIFWACLYSWGGLPVLDIWTTLAHIEVNSQLGISPMDASFPKLGKFKGLEWAPLPTQVGQWPTWDFPHKCVFPKAYFFGLLAGSPTVGL